MIDVFLALVFSPLGLFILTAGGAVTACAAAEERHHP